MKTGLLAITLLLVALLGVCGQSTAQKQNVPIVKLDWLQARMAQPTDTVYVINFWATWCKPCVEEMPDLLKAQKTYESQPVKFFFVSLDFKQDAAKRVYPFVKKRKMSNVVILDETNYDQWLRKVDKNWQGNIPATLILRNQKKKRIFIDRDLKPGETEALVESVLHLNG